MCRIDDPFDEHHCMWPNQHGSSHKWPMLRVPDVIQYEGNQSCTIIGNSILGGYSNILGDWSVSDLLIHSNLPKNDSVIPYGYNGPIGDTAAMNWFMDHDPFYTAVAETDRRRVAELEGNFEVEVD